MSCSPIEYGKPIISQTVSMREYRKHTEIQFYKYLFMTVNFNTHRTGKLPTVPRGDQANPRLPLTNNIKYLRPNRQ